MTIIETVGFLGKGSMAKGDSFSKVPKSYLNINPDEETWAERVEYLLKIIAGSGIAPMDKAILSTSSNSDGTPSDLTADAAALIINPKQPYTQIQLLKAILLFIDNVETRIDIVNTSVNSGLAIANTNTTTTNTRLNELNFKLNELTLNTDTLETITQAILTKQNDLVAQQTALQAGDTATGQPFGRVDLFGVGLMAEKTSVFELKPSYGLSVLRDNVSVNGVVYSAGPYADEVGGEIRLSTTATANDAVILESAQRGIYVAGRSAEVGIGVRIPTLPTGNQEIRWGLFDNQNGFYFGVDAIGLFTAIKRGGAVTKTYQSSWNGDKANGTGSSGLSIALSRGMIFQIVFNWYGYGPVFFLANIPNANNVSRLITLHKFIPSGQTSVIDPNLPIRAEVVNGSTATALAFFVGGRQYSIMGQLQPQVRVTSEYRLALSTTATMVPILALRRKALFRNRDNTASCSVLGIDATAKTNDHMVQLKVGGTIGGGSWGTPSDNAAQETCLESNVGLTSHAGGQPLISILIDQDSRTVERVGGSSGTKSLDLPTNLPIVLLARSVGGNGLLSVILHLEEYW